MLKIYVEVHTSRTDGRLCVVRKEMVNNKLAVLHILKMLSEGFYYTRTKQLEAAMVMFEKPISKHKISDWDWEYGNSPVFHNDYGEVTTICIRRYAEAAQVSEGIYYI